MSRFEYFGAGGASPDPVTAIDAYWSAFLGVAPEALRAGGVVVAEHAGLSGYRGVWFFVRDESAVVSAPPEWAPRLAERLKGTPARQLVIPDFVAALLEGAATALIGPSYQGWLPEAGLRPVETQGVRRLLPSEGAAVAAFRASLPAEEWESSGMGEQAHDLWGDFWGGRLVAAGRLRSRAGGVSDPCVITSAARRGRGHGARVVSALATQAVRANQLVLYQTLVANEPALAIARRLGFQQYAILLAARLGPQAVP